MTAQQTALAGPSGSGKSTIANLLMRFYDCPSDSILLDGRDIKDFDSKSLRRSCAYVGQDAVILDDSVEENIRYAPLPKRREALIEVSKAISVHEVIEALPQSYDTLLGEHGARLSGGERQRISIARALAKPHEFLILDEATSALDARTETDTVRGIERLSEGKTCLIISHRLATIRNASEIVYLCNGEVRERGTFDQLLELRGEFYAQWQNQSGDGSANCHDTQQ